MAISHKYNKFYGGFSPQDYAASDSQVMWSENLQIRKDPYFIKLQSKPVEVLNTSDDITSILLATSGGSNNMIFAGDGGDIYDTNSVDLTPEHTLSTAKDIKNGKVFNDKIVWIAHAGTGAAVQLHEITLANAAAGTINGNVSATSTSGDSLPNGADTTLYPMLNYLDTYLFIGVGGQLLRLDTNDILSANFQGDNTYNGDIVGITEHGGLIVVYTNQGEVTWINPTDGTVSAAQRWDTPVINVTQDTQFDYVLSGAAVEIGQLWKVSGFERQMISRITESLRLSDLKFSYQMFTPQGMVYTDGFLYVTSSDGIYSFGAELPGYPESFNIETAQSSGNNDFTALQCMARDHDVNLYYYVNDGAKRIIDRVALRDFSPSSVPDAGYLITNIFDGGDRSTKKDLQEIKLMTKNSTGNDNIKLYYKVDGGSWVLIGTASSSGAITSEKFNLEDDDSNFADFYDIQFKAVWASAGTNNPELYEIKFIYDLIEE